MIQLTQDPTRLAAAQHNPDADRDSRWTAWIKAIAKGDLNAFAALYDETSTVIFTLVLQMIPDRQVAEELLIDIYQDARQKASRFNPREQSPLVWLVTLARNFTVASMRASGAVASAESVFFQEQQAANAVLAGLTEEQRSILQMTYFGGLSAYEAANLLALSREYVVKQIVAGLNKLRIVKAGAYAAGRVPSKPREF